MNFPYFLKSFTKKFPENLFHCIFYLYMIFFFRESLNCSIFIIKLLFYQKKFSEYEVHDWAFIGNFLTTNIWKANKICFSFSFYVSNEMQEFLSPVLFISVKQYPNNLSYHYRFPIKNSTNHCNKEEENNKIILIRLDCNLTWLPDM